MATISENLQTLIDIKSDIKTAIINKGVDVADSDGFDTYSTKIESITTGGDGIDFSVIGYTSTDSANPNNKIEEYIAYSKTLYDAWDSSNTSANRLYYNDDKLVYAPAINTSNVINMSQMFSGCASLTYIPELNTSNVTNMEGMFTNCTTLKRIHQLNTSNVTRAYYMFNNCHSLTTIPELDCSSLDVVNGMFFTCYDLTYIGGLKDLGKGFIGDTHITNTLDLTHCPLTRESALNVLNGLYDLNNNTSYKGKGSVEFSSTTLALLSDDDIAIATNKGWTITQ